MVRISDIFSEKAILSNPQSAVNSQKFYKALINRHLEFMKTDNKIKKIRLDDGFRKKIWLICWEYRLRSKFISGETKPNELLRELYKLPKF